MIKVAVPNMTCQIVDWAIQAHGGGGTQYAPMEGRIRFCQPIAGGMAVSAAFERQNRICT